MEGQAEDDNRNLSYSRGNNAGEQSMSADKDKHYPLVIAVMVALSILAAVIVFWLTPSDPERGATFRELEATSGDEGDVETPDARPSPPETAPEQRSASSGSRGAALRLVSAVVEEDAAATQGSFAGRVVSWSTGEGVSGAELTFSHGGIVTSVTSNDAGAFALIPTEEGLFELAVVTADGYLPFAPEWGHSPVRLVARAGFRVRDIVITLRPAIEYHGRVVDPEGAPVASATVTLVELTASESELVPLPRQFESDTEGRFTFNAPDQALLEARHPDFSPGRARLDASAQIAHSLEIQLGPADDEQRQGSIAGVVVDAEGEPLAEALVLAHIESDNRAADAPEQDRRARVMSDEEGRFFIEELDEGRYRVMASAEGSAPAIARDVALGTTDLRLELSAGATLRGEVTSAESGEPVGAFSVVVTLRVSELARESYRNESIIDPSGEYEIAGIDAGDYEIIVMAHGHAPSEPRPVTVPEPVPAEPVEADFTLSRGGSLSGTVIDSESREPLENARVSVEAAVAWAGAAGSVVPLVASATTDSEGRFELGGLTSGLRSIYVAAHQHHARIISGLSFDEDGNVGPLTIDLRPVAEGEEPRLELTGIGAVLTAQDDVLVIGRMIEGGGALEAGLQPNDAILEVDGVSVTELGFQGSIERIRGPEGSTVRLTVRRAGQEEAEVVVVTRRRIQA